MTLLRQIQEEAASGELASVLRRCKILASRLDNAPLADWIRHESEGFPPSAELPSYRTLHMRPRGNFSGPFGSGINNAEIPIGCIPSELRDRFTLYECRESMSSIERIVSKGEGQVYVPIMPDLLTHFSGKVYQYMNCLSAWGELPTSCLIQIVDHVRNKVLDFALSIEKLDSNAGELAIGQSPLSSRQITQVFNTTVHGGAVNVLDEASHSRVSASLVTKSNIDSLQRLMAKSGVTNDDIEELVTAIAAEPKIGTDQSFGPKVQSWIGKMIGKAASGAWKIGSGAAGSLLAGAIRAYYGLPS